MQNVSVLVAGDCGFGFTTIEGDKYALSKLRRYADKNNVTVYFLRGNHDNPQYFKNEFSVGKHLKCIPDYTVIHSVPQDFNVVCIGGATSIDRSDRIGRYQKRVLDYMKYHRGNEQEALQKVQKAYWEDEAPVYDEQSLDEINETLKIDFVVAHTCPSFCQPLTKDGLYNWMANDKDLEKDLNDERQTMDKILKRLWEAKQPIKKWVYGHFHYHNYDSINGIDYVMLDMSGMGNGVCDMVELRK